MGIHDLGISRSDIYNLASLLLEVGSSHALVHSVQLLLFMLTHGEAVSNGILIASWRLACTQVMWKALTAAAATTAGKRRVFANCVLGRWWAYAWHTLFVHRHKRPHAFNGRERDGEKHKVPQRSKHLKNATHVEKQLNYTATRINWVTRKARNIICTCSKTARNAMFIYTYCVCFSYHSVFLTRYTIQCSWLATKQDFSSGNCIRCPF
jgi:hypothetical protein